MKRGLRIGNRRVRLRFFIFLFVLTGAIIYFISPTENLAAYGTIDYGEITITDTVGGLVIRQEDVIPVQEYGRVEYHVLEGTRVNKDQLIAVLYKPDYDESLVYDLYGVQQKINNYQEENILYDIADQDLKKVQEKIKGTLSEIQERLRDDDAKGLDKQERQLRELLLQRQEMMDEKTVPDDYLKQLYEEEAEIHKKLESWRIPIISPDAGLISFHLDGLENVLTFESVDLFTVDQFRNLLESQKAAGEISPLDEEQPFFRLVNPLKWYIVCEFNQKNVYYDTGDIIAIKVDGNDDTEYQGKVYNTIKGKDGELVIVELSDGLQSFINYRNVYVQTRKKVKGLRVPARSLIEEHGQTGVNVLYHGKSVFIRVRVKGMNGQYAVIEKIGDVEGLEIGDQILIGS